MLLSAHSLALTCALFGTSLLGMLSWRRLAPLFSFIVSFIIIIIIFSAYS